MKDERNENAALPFMEEIVTPDITRLRVPFEDLYTSVFIVTTSQGAAILDCATTEADVEQYILPALSRRGLVPKLIFASHSHSDHMGGMPYLAKAFPTATVAMLRKDKAQNYPESQRHVPERDELLLGCLRVLPLPGHSPDSAAILDERTKTLLTFDCLQAQGVSRFGTGLSNIADYLSTISEISSQNMEMLVASHEYTPVGSIARGRAAIDRYLAACLEDVTVIRNFIQSHPNRSPAEVASLFNAAHPAHPPIPTSTISAFRM